MSSSTSRGSRKTTEGKRDPSMAPFAGFLMWVPDELAGTTVIGTLNSGGCSLRGVPAVVVLDNTGDTIATCTAASLAGDRLELTFNADTTGAAAIRFAENDPAVRGPIGQYAYPGNQTQGATQPPADLLSAEWDPDNNQVIYVWPVEMTIVGDATGVYSAKIAGGQGKVSTSSTAAAGTSIYQQLEDASQTTPEGFTESVSLNGILESTIGAVTPNPVPLTAIVPQVVYATLQLLPDPIITIQFDRQTTPYESSPAFYMGDDGGVNYKCVGSPRPESTATMLVFDAEIDGLTTPSSWTANESSFVNVYGAPNQQQSGTH